MPTNLDSAGSALVAWQSFLPCPEPHRDQAVLVILNRAITILWSLLAAAGLAAALIAPLP